MSKLQASVYLFVAYFVCSLFLCGDMVTPLADLPVMSPSRSRDLWNVFVVGSLVVAIRAVSMGYTCHLAGIPPGAVNDGLDAIVGIVGRNLWDVEAQ